MFANKYLKLLYIFLIVLSVFPQSSLAFRGETLKDTILEKILNGYKGKTYDEIKVQIASWPEDLQRELLQYVPKTEFYTIPANNFKFNELPSSKIYSLAVAGDSLFVGHDLGLSISYDGGQTFLNRTTANGLGA